MTTLIDNSTIVLSDNKVSNLSLVSETLSKSFDKKNKLNRATEVIDSNLIKEIETNGVTYEMLNTLNLPIFRYQTQITIHGIFDDRLNNIYGIGGYKNIIVNKNKSLGIRYNAIDYTKKIELSKLVCMGNVGYYRSSTENYFSLVSRDKTTATEFYNKIDTSLFIGDKKLYTLNFYGLFYYVCIVNINAFPIENFNAIAENITSKSIDELKSIRQQKLDEQARKQREWNDKYEAEKKAKLEALQPTIKEIESKESFTFDETKKDSVFIHVDATSSFKPIKIYKYIGKRGAYHTIKYLSFDVSQYNEIKNDINLIDFNSYNVSKMSDKDINILIKRMSKRNLYKF